LCIVAICEKRSLNEDEFERCFTGNNHGMGYAFWDGEKVTLSKGFMLIEEAGIGWRGEAGADSSFYLYP